MVGESGTSCTGNKYHYYRCVNTKKKKLCDALTDALRLERLSSNGYDATALELTDPDDTPKNILLRAVKKNMPNNDAVTKYNDLCNKLVGDKQLFIKG